MFPKVILDINDELLLIEDIFKLFLPLPKDAIYVKNNRYPMTRYGNLEKLAEHDLLSDTPWHPVLCIPAVNDLLLLKIYAYEESDDFNLFRKNPLIPSGGIDHLPMVDSSYEDIIRLYINQINKTGIDEIMKYINIIYRKILSHIESYPDYLFQFEYNTNYVVLLNCGDIKGIRFKEYLEYKSIEDDCKSSEVYNV